MILIKISHVLNVLKDNLLNNIKKTRNLNHVNLVDQLKKKKKKNLVLMPMVS